MTDNVIKARFNGADMRFSIPRDQLHYLEEDLDCSAFELFKTFGRGAWRAEHVSKILCFASTNGYSEKELDTLSIIPGARLLPRRNKPKAVESVEHVLATKPLAPYAILAQMVLGAALFGVKPAEAAFSDEHSDAA